MNGDFGPGYSPAPLSNDGRARRSTAMGYRDEATRRRPNLQIWGDARVNRILFEKRRATGAEALCGGAVQTITADNVVVCAGALHTPWLLMLSGIGPAEPLRSHGVAMQLDKPGVGQHLMNHPVIHISGYLAPVARHKLVLRRNYAYLRYSSGLSGEPEEDMVMMAICRSAWRAVGQRIGTLSAYIGHSHSTGEVRLVSANPDDEPIVNFNWLSHARDLGRMTGAFRHMSAILKSEPVPKYMSYLFSSLFSQRVRNVGKKTLKNAVLTGAAALLMDSSTTLRRLFVDRYINDCPSLSSLLADGDELERHVRNVVQSAWHPSCTGRMCDPADPRMVVEPDGKVVEINNLYIADASFMPMITRTNTNIPTVMIAERFAEGLGERGMA
jgi:5-(hydroxymethyl)furfural/furfural oxidase